MQCLTNSAMRCLLFGSGATPPPHHHGLLVTRVMRFSCCEAAGVRPGDLLLAIDGEALSEEGEVSTQGLKPWTSCLLPALLAHSIC